MLVSFPPLNYMLKFGGSSCLIGDPIGEILAAGLFKGPLARSRSALHRRPLGTSRQHWGFPRTFLLLAGAHRKFAGVLVRWRTRASSTTPADWCLEWRRLKRSFNRVCRARGVDKMRVYSSRDDSIPFYRGESTLRFHRPAGAFAHTRGEGW